MSLGQVHSAEVVVGEELPPIQVQVPHGFEDPLALRRENEGIRALYIYICMYVCIYIYIYRDIYIYIPFKGL